MKFWLESLLEGKAQESGRSLTWRKEEYEAGVDKEKKTCKNDVKVYIKR